jgi:hypothetical protein
MDNKRIIIAIVLLFLIYKIVSKIFRNKETNTSENVNVNKTNLSYPENEYLLMADTIEEAAWGTFGSFTEDDALMFGTMAKLQNNDDLYQLTKVYGIRGVGLVIVDEYNLVQTIEKFLDNDYKRQLNALYAQRGITYRFTEN